MRAKEWVDLFSALLTPVIAVVGTLIAIQQWRINQIKLRHELYQKRLDVYTAFCELLGAIVRSANVTDEELRAFLQKTRESHFLFEDELCNYLREVYEKAVDVQCNHTMIHGHGSLPVGEERTKTIQKNTELLKWLSRQFESGRERFRPYMRLTA